MLAVAVERHLPGDLLGRRVDLYRAGQPADGGQHLNGHGPDGPVGGERDALDLAVAVLDDRLVGPQVQGDAERPRTVWGRQRSGLQAPCRQAQRRVL